MSTPLRIGLCGLGTVGQGVVDILTRHQQLLTTRCGRGLEVAAIAVRDPTKSRDVALDGIDVTSDARALAERADIDVIVEAIGGADGIAREVIAAAIARGKSVVTANKALIAHHGAALAEAAERAGVSLNFEASVAGGLPIVKLLREGLAANQLERVYGILNGTCNYILTEMERTGASFETVLAEAQALGYAEADPSFDIDGIDTAHKLAILCSLAFGTRVDFASVHVEGIRSIEAADIAYARELGYRIKLLGIARRSSLGIEQRVHPCFVPLGTPIADVSGVFNAVVAEGDFVGRVFLEGRGAGRGATASAVVADLIDLTRGLKVSTFAVPAGALRMAPSLPMAEHVGACYVRLSVRDRPGVMAGITAHLARHGVSIETMIQRGRAPGEAVGMVMVLHETRDADLERALGEINALEAVLAPAKRVRMETI